MAIENWNFIKVKNLIDVSKYIEEPPLGESKHLRYYNTGVSVVETREEQNMVIRGKTFSRYNYPKLKPILFEIKHFLKELLEEDLFETYCFDRFYFADSRMFPHTDREACEISVSLNISSNVTEPYPLWIKTEEGEVPLYTDPGDAVIYKGREFKHWRDPMIGDRDSYHHQAFFHYIRADGHYVERAWDATS